MSTLEGCSGTKLPKVSMIYCGLTSYYRLHGLEKLFYDHSWSCGWTGLNRAVVMVSFLQLCPVVTGLESFEGSFGGDIQDGFFPRRSTASAGWLGQLVGSGALDSSRLSPCGHFTCLAWASSQHGRLRGSLPSDFLHGS